MSWKRKQSSYGQAGQIPTGVGWQGKCRQPTCAAAFAIPNPCSAAQSAAPSLPTCAAALPDQIGFLDSLKLLNISAGFWSISALPASWTRAGVFPNMEVLDTRWSWELGGEGRTLLKFYSSAGLGQVASWQQGGHSY